MKGTLRQPVQTVETACLNWSVHRDIFEQLAASQRRADNRDEDVTHHHRQRLGGEPSGRPRGEQGTRRYWLTSSPNRESAHDLRTSLRCNNSANAAQVHAHLPVPSAKVTSSGVVALRFPAQVSGLIMPS